MSVIKFYYNNVFDASTTTATALTTNANFPLANLKNIWKTKHHRTIADADQWWKWNIGATAGAVGLKATIFLYHNFTAAADIDLYAHDTDLGDDPAVWAAHGDTLKVSLVYGTDWNSSLLCKYWSSAQTYRWWLLSVDDPDGDGYLRLGRAYADPAGFAPTRTYSTYSHSKIDPSPVIHSIGGQINATERESYEVWRYGFLGLTDANVTSLTSIFDDYVGKTTPFFICRNPASALTTTNYVENISDWVFESIATDINNVNIEVKESI